MKKNTIKAFTLVEMLIVIVIIGILIAALMPRMQSAQWRARDVARKNDLSQIQTAIVTSQQDKWFWPGIKGAMDNSWTVLTTSPATAWMAISDISKLLLTAWMSAVPKDPLSSTKVTWLWSATIADWQYAYLVATKNWTTNWWFVLMAKTEIEWWSNWIFCGSGASGIGAITSSTDIARNFQICTSFNKNEAAGASCSMNNWLCTYTADDQLRYIVTY